MARIHITGTAGAGKSTLAVRIGRLLDHPVFGLDEIVWKPGWEKTDATERSAKERELCARPSWIIEGVSARVRQSADTIVFLDVPRYVSFWRCAKRNWRYLFRSRPGLPAGCPEIRILPRLVRMIWRFPRLVRPAILADLADCAARKTVVIIRSEAELRAFLHGLDTSDNLVRSA